MGAACTFMLNRMETKRGNLDIYEQARVDLQLWGLEALGW